MKISIIVAVGEDMAIGRNGDLIWHIPADLKHFKNLTMGHPIIMGRNTWESLPKGALPGRRNIVLTRTPGYETPGAEQARSLSEALELCQTHKNIEGSNPSTVYIIGGGHLYREALPMAQELELTRVQASCSDADTHFPEIDLTQWHVTHSSAEEITPSGIKYHYETLERNPD